MGKLWPPPKRSRSELRVANFQPSPSASRPRRPSYLLTGRPDNIAVNSKRSGSPTFASVQTGSKLVDRDVPGARSPGTAPRYAMSLFVHRMTLRWWNTLWSRLTTLTRPAMAEGTELVLPPLEGLCGCRSILWLRSRCSVTMLSKAYGYYRHLQCIQGNAISSTVPSSRARRRACPAVEMLF